MMEYSGKIRLIHVQTFESLDLSHTNNETISLSPLPNLTYVVISWHQHFPVVHRAGLLTSKAGIFHR